MKNNNNNNNNEIKHKIVDLITKDTDDEMMETKECTVSSEGDIVFSQECKSKIKDVDITNVHNDISENGKKCITTFNVITTFVITITTKDEECSIKFVK
ncbi:hypothetical protein [Romboutsia sp.]|uniref:hypothetical protein n=1 Tax=Romboutsia sp. TaxID=1965302 RepID=UPI003F384097